MKSRATRSFWRMFDALPPDVQDRPRRAYALWHADPDHPSIRFKRIDGEEPIYRRGSSWRTVRSVCSMAIP